MTTESQQDHRSRGPRVLLAAAGCTVVLAVVATVLGGVLAGRPAASGAAVGGVVVLAVLGLGTFVVDTTARLVPTAALLLALLTYTCQVVLLAALFAGLTHSGLLGGAVDRGWLAGTLIVGTLGWTLVQLVRSMQVRIPAFEPAVGARGAVAVGVPGRPQGGER